MRRELLEGIAPLAGWIIVSLIYDALKGREAEIVIRSLTPTEITNYIVEKVDAYIGPYLAACSCAAKKENCEKFKDLIERFREQVINAVCRQGVVTEEEKVRSCEESVRSMDIKELIAFAKSRGAIQPPPSFLFVGPPGVGKSESVMEAAKRIAEKYGLEFVDLARVGPATLSKLLDRNLRPGYFVFVDIRLTSVEPADLMGIPMRRSVGHTEVSEYIPFSWVEVLALGPGMLFLDELTNVRREDVLAAAYQLILDRKSGFRTFDPGVVVASAGNPPQWSAIARKLPTPLHTRLEVFNTVPPTIFEWELYMVRRYGDAWCRYVLTTIMYLGDEGWVARHAPPTALGPQEQIPLPRSWTRLAVQLYRVFAPRAREKGVGVDEYVRALLTKAALRGGCTAVSHIRPGEPGYDELAEAKICCEMISANVGTEMANVMSSLAVVVLPPIGYLLEHPDETAELIKLSCLATAYVLGASIPSDVLEKIQRIFGRVERPRIELRGREAELIAKLREDMKEVSLPAVRLVLIELFSELSDVIERWCQEGKEEVMKHVDQLAKIIDGALQVLEEKAGGIEPPFIVLLALLLSPICRRRWVDVKMELMKRSKRLTQLIDKLAELVVGGG